MYMMYIPMSSETLCFSPLTFCDVNIVSKDC